MAERPDSTEDSSPIGVQNANAWGPAVWGPLGLLVAQGLFGLVFNPIGSAPPDNEVVMGLLIGAMLTQPMICALWAAWATSPAVQRTPTGVAACTLLFLLASLRGQETMFAVLYFSLGFLFWALLAVLRWRAGWQLSIGELHDAASARRRENQFSIRYLLGWTTVAAALCALASMASSPSSPMRDGIWEITVFASVFTVLLLPAPAMACVVLSRTPSKERFWALAVLILVSTSAASILISQTSPSPGFAEVFKVFSFFSFGSLLGAAASAVVLRWAGYRIVKTKPNPAAGG